MRTTRHSRVAHAWQFAWMGVMAPVTFRIATAADLPTILTYIPGLSRGGMRRALVEAVRVRSDLRGQRIGEQLMEDAMTRARARGCGMMQLTTDKRRTDAHRFYARLGFEASHEGMKRAL